MMYDMPHGAKAVEKALLSLNTMEVQCDKPDSGSRARLAVLARLGNKKDLENRRGRIVTGKAAVQKHMEKALRHFQSAVEVCIFAFFSSC